MTRQHPDRARRPFGYGPATPGRIVEIDRRLTAFRAPQFGQFGTKF